MDAARSNASNRRPLRQAIQECESKWFIETIAAANDGEANQMALLGHMYTVGYGCKPDPAEAQRWYDEASKRVGFNVLTEQPPMHYPTGPAQQPDYPQQQQQQQEEAQAEQPCSSQRSQPRRDQQPQQQQQQHLQQLGARPRRSHRDQQQPQQPQPPPPLQQQPLGSLTEQQLLVRLGTGGSSSSMSGAVSCAAGSSQQLQREALLAGLEQGQQAPA